MGVFILFKSAGTVSRKERDTSFPSIIRIPYSEIREVRVDAASQAYFKDIRVITNSSEHLIAVYQHKNLLECDSHLIADSIPKANRRAGFKESSKVIAALMEDLTNFDCPDEIDVVWKAVITNRTDQDNYTIWTRKQNTRQI